MTTKTYAIAEEQRDMWLQIMRNNLQDPGAYDAISELESLPLITGEPVARMLHSLKPLVTINSDIARSYAEYPESKHTDVWREGAKLYTHPQPLQPITADDVTDEMWKAYYKTSPETTIEKSDFAAAYNAVIKHKGDTK